MEGSANEFGSIGAAIPGFFLAFVWIISRLITRTIHYSNGIFFLLFFCLWMITTFFWSAHQDVTLNTAFSYLMIFVFYWLVFDSIRKSEDVLLLIASYITGLLLLSLTAAVNISDGVGYDGLYNRYSANGTDPNNFGMMLASSLPLIAIFCLCARKIIYVSAGVAAFTFFSYLIISTASRASSISLVLTLFLLPLICANKSKKTQVLFFYSILLFFGFFGITAVSELIPENAQERLFNGLATLDGDDRFLVWKEIFFIYGIEIFGIGAGATFAEIGIQAHNTFISALLEAGLLGFILWVAFWLYHFFKIYTVQAYSNRQLRNLFLLTVFLLLIASFTLNWEFRKPLFFILALSSKWVILVSINSSRNLIKQ